MESYVVAYADKVMEGGIRVMRTTQDLRGAIYDCEYISKHYKPEYVEVRELLENYGYKVTYNIDTVTGEIADRTRRNKEYPTPEYSVFFSQYRQYIIAYHEANKEQLLGISLRDAMGDEDGMYEDLCRGEYDPSSLREWVNRHYGEHLLDNGVSKITG